MTPLEYLRQICTECGGSVAIDELPLTELILVALCEQAVLTHAIAGLAIVTMDGWATVGKLVSKGSV